MTWVLKLISKSFVAERFLYFSLFWNYNLRVKTKSYGIVENTQEGDDILGLPKWLSGKETPCQCRRHWCNPWVEKIPWGRTGQPTLIFVPGKCYG